MSEVLVKVEGVSKKFCKNLKRHMFYTIQDIIKSMVGISPKTDELRPGEFWAVKDVSFEVRRGECLGLIGPNGAGKSTLLKLLNGIIYPDKGLIVIKGRVGALIELTAGFHPMLTGRENIYVSGSILGLSKKEIDRKFDAIVEFSELGDFIDTPVKHYSSGMKVRLGFAIAAQMEPDVLLIDEVLAVGDVGFRAKCLNKVNQILKNTAVIYVSHQMAEVARICTSVLLLSQGIGTFYGNKVSNGIENYYSMFNYLKNTISGSGKAIIHDIKFSSNCNFENQEDLFKVKYLDDLYITITLSLDKSISKAVIDIVFLNRELRGVAQCYSHHSNFKIKNINNIIKVRVKIPKLQLNPGIYYLAVVILDENCGEILANYFAIKTIQVIGSCIGYTPIQINTEWKYVTECTYNA